MNQDILKLIASQGIFALLFCYLLFYVLKENHKREENYQEIIQDLTGILPSIQADIVYIKNKFKSN